jgi:hypothetical protein
MIKLSDLLKKYFMIFVLLVFFSLSLNSSPSLSSATLISQLGGQLAFDDTTGLVWVTNIEQFINESYNEQIASISALAYTGFTGFRMATVQEVLQLFNYGAPAIFAFPFSPQNFLSGRTSDLFTSYIDQPGVHKIVYSLPPGPAQVYLSMDPLADGANSIDGAWVVGRAVPEPTTILLLGIGMIGLFGFRRIQKKV